MRANETMPMCSCLKRGAIRCNTLPDDKARPTGKETFFEHWGKIKGRQTPQPSPISSDDKGSVDDDASDNDNNDEVALKLSMASLTEYWFLVMNSTLRTRTENPTQMMPRSLK